MRVAIASDIHDNLSNLKKFLDFVKKEGIKTLILCGDTGNQETFEFINDNFKGKTLVVPGNLETWQKSEIRSAKSETLEISGLKIAVAHFPAEAKKLAQTQKYDFVFYGHTHKPWLEQIGKCILANPGNLAGIIYKASFAVLDGETKNLALKILEKI